MSARPAAPPHERLAGLAAAAVAFVALAAFSLTGPLRSPGPFVRDNAIDFVAVYCGIATAAAGADPYRVEPLRTCEHTVVPQRSAANAWVVVPAPLPPYTFALLRPLTALPFPLAKAVWVWGSFAAFALTGWCAALVTGLPIIGVLALLLPAIGLLNLHFGEPVPFAIASIGLAAVCAQRERHAAAGAFAALALLEPHLGLGACAGAFTALPRARAGLLVTGTILAAAGIAESGWSRSVEYLTPVLPLQAHSELAVNYQLSLTHAVTLAGGAAKAALALGSASYVFTLVLGTVAAAFFARRRGAAAAALYLPVTFTMLGGTYIHTPEIAAALPGALLACRLLTGTARVAAAAGLALLVMPWNAASGDGIVSSVPLGLAAAFVALVAVRARDPAPVSGALLGTVLLAVYIALLPAPSLASHVRAANPRAIGPAAWASDDWEMFVNASHRLHDEDARHVLLKLPQWLGLLLVTGALAAPLLGAVQSRRKRTASTPAA